MTQNLRNPSIVHRDYGATSTNQMNVRIPDVTFSPTEFMHLSENIAENIQSVRSSWQQLEKAHKTINKNRNASDSQKERIHNIQTQTNQKIQTTSSLFSSLATAVQRGDKQQKLQLEKLTSEFQTIVSKYSEIQQQIVKTMKQLVLIAATQQEEDPTYANEKDREELIQRQLQMQNGMFENDLLQDRETKIREIEADVLDVNAIMRELSTLVNQQGEQIGKNILILKFYVNFNTFLNIRSLPSLFHTSLLNLLEYFPDKLEM